MSEAKPPVRHGNDGEIVARTPRDLKTMSDVDLLGADYKGWLAEEKGEVARTLRDGDEVRARAERLMARSEALLKSIKEPS